MAESLRILLVADGAVDRRALSSRLGVDLPGCHVTSAADAQSLATAVRGESFELAIVDHELPWTDGLTVLRDLKARWPQGAVLLLVPAKLEDVAVQALGSGVDDYLLKQPDLPTLLSLHARKALEQVRWRREARQAEERYRRLWDEASVGLYRTTPDGLFLDANRALVEMLGHPSRESLLRTRATDLYVDPSDRQRWRDALAREGVVRGFETRLRRADGPLIWVRETAHAVRDDAQAVLSYEGSLEDVTARRDAEEALRASEEWYRTLFDAHPVPVWVFDEKSLAFVAVNRASIESYGYSREEFLGMTLADIRPAEDVPSPLVHLSLANAERDSVGAWRHRKKDGTIIDVEIRSYSMSFAGRRARLVLATDVTERRRAEEERARLSLAVEQADEAIIITDPKGTILYANPACERITGYSRAEAVGGNPRALKSGKHDAAFYRSLWSTLLKGEVWRGHFVNKRKDGTLFEAEASISPVRDAAGHLVNYVGVERDVTHEKRLEGQFLQSQKMEAVGRLAGGVAHDFNNLLSVIAGYSELVLRHLPADGPLRGKVEQILKASHRAAGLTRQLLAFSRRQVLEPRVLDLNLVVADMESMLRRLIGEDIDLLTTRDPALGCVKADPGQIEQVLMNLVVNARDAMPDGGQLGIETRNVYLDDGYRREHVGVRPGASVMLAVSDTGTGMDGETRSHLFEPFFTTKPKGKGTGLGLSTVYGIVTQSGGHISVESELGRGTSFRIYLPRVDEAIEPAVPCSGAFAAAGSETILVVEDDGMLRELVRETLEGSGYAVLVSSDGEDAQRVAMEHPGTIDLLLTDVIMPGKSGPETARRLASQRPGMPVLYISGHPDDAILPHGVMEPGVAFLGKPFTPASLLQKVGEVLRCGGAYSATTSRPRIVSLSGSRQQ